MTMNRARRRDESRLNSLRVNERVSTREKCAQSSVEQKGDGPARKFVLRRKAVAADHSGDVRLEKRRALALLLSTSMKTGKEVLLTFR
jgi:hypothetical protein